VQLGTSVAVPDRGDPVARTGGTVETNDALPMRSQIRDGNRQIAGARELAARLRALSIVRMSWNCMSIPLRNSAPALPRMRASQAVSASARGPPGHLASSKAASRVRRCGRRFHAGRGAGRKRTQVAKKVARKSNEGRTGTQPRGTGRLTFGAANDAGAGRNPRARARPRGFEPLTFGSVNRGSGNSESRPIRPARRLAFHMRRALRAKSGHLARAAADDCPSSFGSVSRASATAPAHRALRQRR
jgi:hypothetical protein